jgi:site-specific recombinase XerD
MPRRQKRRVYKAIRSEEYELLIREAPSQDYRDLFALMRWAGLRVSEACGLQWTSVDLEGQQLTIIGKGDVERSIDLLEDAEEILRRRREALTGPAVYVFPGYSDTGTVAPRSVQRVMQRIRTKHGLPKERVHPHSLRHYFASDALENDVDLHDLRDALGHSNISTTSTYLHSRRGRLRGAYQRRRD